MKTEKLYPECKDNLWGGTKLIEKYGKQTSKRPCAESWEISFHENGLTRLADGRTLKEAATKEDLGANAAQFERFPLLAKFIDASQDLSVQVHPTDFYALRDYNSYGKTEMWYVAEAEEGAGIYLGFNRDVTAEECERAIREKTLASLLRFYPVKKGEHYFVPAGTVHAICAGCLIFEIQQNCDLTYRLYDYGRKDKNGKERELHVEKALETARLKAGDKIAFRAAVNEGERIGISRYFTLTYAKIQGEREFSTDPASFRAITCVSGEGNIDGNAMRRGDTFFVPATRGAFTVSGDAEILISEVRRYRIYYRQKQSVGEAERGEITLYDDLNNRLTSTEFQNGQSGSAAAFLSALNGVLSQTGTTYYDIASICVEQDTYKKCGEDFNSAVFKTTGITLRKQSV
ncbi:MAG: type I phosphomannose isomerase catalytic subunit [Candidatus Borkfalkiaceae bacterium]|nr:class I mannose-6-phosphate isomerase [Clostridia bacterium]MDY6224076.1 type I phosphomannose isomerase catalytic subunit [Christensenellaceae bacterium]